MTLWRRNEKKSATMGLINLHNLLTCFTIKLFFFAGIDNTGHPAGETNDQKQ